MTSTLLTPAFLDLNGSEVEGSGDDEVLPENGGVDSSERVMTQRKKLKKTMFRMGGLAQKRVEMRERAIRPQTL